MSLELRGAAYRYPSGQAWALHPLDLVLRPGEIALVAGPTGCGKSTLLRVAAGLLEQHGRGALQGEVRVHGQPLADLPPRERVRRIGFVAQEPMDQLVTGTLGDEVAFAMESAGFEAATIAERIPELLRTVRLPYPPERDNRALSGGQTQRLVVAAALSAGAGVLLLDEPLAWLDPAGAVELMDTLRALADEGVAVLLVEHRLELCLPRVDRVLLLDQGRLVADAPAETMRAGTPLFRQARALGLALPGLADLEDRLGRDPASVPFEASPLEESPVGPPLLSLAIGDFRWPGAAEPALFGLSLTVHAGERIALIGPNGAGKSTLLARLSAPAPRDGGRCVAVPQDPDLALFCATVREELAFGPRELGLPTDRIGPIARALGVEPFFDRPPQALSRGQRLRVAVAAALTCGPALLTLDEPTAGQDQAHTDGMMEALAGALHAGALVFATHDLDLALRYATRVIVLDRGRVILDGPPARALAAGLRLPGLAAFCLERGLRPDSPAALAERAR